MGNDAARPAAGSPAVITHDAYDAVLFDLDGVLTKTALVHATAWKSAFDAFLEHHAREKGTAFVPFDKGSDYVAYVDGKPRYDGVRSFLASRDITLPDGDPSVAPGFDTVCALGNLKNDQVNAALERDGVQTYDGAITLLHHLREAGIGTAVVSSSKNCLAVITTAGIVDLFDVRVDGVVAAELGLAGKPDPATYLEAARELGAEPARAVVVEDALAGVESGRAGDFGLVVGVDRVGGTHAQDLVAHGADLAVTDLATLIPSS